MLNKFPLATSTWDEAEYQAMDRVIKSGSFTMGSEVESFERNFAEYFGSQFAVMVNSGSSANLLMTAALFYVSDPLLRLAPGDEVIVPAVSWSTTYFPLHQYGLVLKFVDIDPNTLNFNLTDLKEAITEKTKAIMIVNLLGNPNDFDAINEMIGQKKIILLEDNCESMGAIYKGKYTGNFGVLGSFSTYFSHHISTMEGGMVITDNEELYHIMLSLRAHGWTRQLPDKNKLFISNNGNTFDASYKFVLPGYNLRPLELSGAVGVEQLKKLPSIIEGRRKNAAFFQEVFADHPVIFIQKEIEVSSWFGFSLILRPDAHISRKHFITALEKNGFECRPIVAGNFVKNPVIDLMNTQKAGELLGADLIDKNGLFVGNHHYPIFEAIEKLKKISDNL